MTDPSELRIGDAERQEAAELLGDHLAAGRIDYDEFEQRVGAVLAARTEAELAAPFDDLPGRRPGRVRGASALDPAPAARVGAASPGVVMGMGVWAAPAVVTLLAAFMVLGVLGWWMSFAPAFLPLVFITVSRLPRQGARYPRCSSPRMR